MNVIVLFVQVIFTDKTPVALYYVEHLDEVWVLCWNSDTDTGSKTVVVIRNASQKTQHHSVHTQPIGNRFDVVSINGKICHPTTVGPLLNMLAWFVEP